MATPSDPIRGQACLEVVGLTELPSEYPQISIAEETDVCTRDIKEVIHGC